jgi:hypothetical protein
VEGTLLLVCLLGCLVLHTQMETELYVVASGVTASDEGSWQVHMRVAVQTASTCSLLLPVLPGFSSSERSEGDKLCRNVGLHNKSLTVIIFCAFISRNVAGRVLLRYCWY